jgi:hypothetical protein
LLLSGVALGTAILSTALVAAQVPSGPPQPYPAPQADDLSQVPVIRLLDDVDPHQKIVPAGGFVEPPDPNEELLREISRLHKEREDLAKERQKIEGRPPEADSAAAVELSQLRGRLTTVLHRLAVIPPAVRPGNPTQEATLNPGDFNPSAPNTANMTNTQIRARPSGDSYLQAQSLFRGGQYKEALAAYRGLQPESLSGEERLLVQYLCACCLRKLGKLDEAATLYRQVADAREDDLLTECSLWHLGTIGWRRDLERQLADIRAARQAR